MYLLFSHSVVSDTSRPHGLQHTRLPCPSPSAGSRHIAYWVQHFPQHHLSGSGIAQLEFCHCRKPAWGTSTWQRSWRRRLSIHKGGIELQESPWKFSSIYPQNQSLPTFCFVLSPTPLTLQGGCPPLPLSEKRVSLQLQLIIPGCDSVSIYKLLWKSSSLPE